MGLFLVLFGVAAVILFIVLCKLQSPAARLINPHAGWGLVWKLLLSRLGLFKELFSDLRGDKKEADSSQLGRGRRQVEHSTTRPPYSPTGGSSRKRIGVYSGDEH